MTATKSKTGETRPTLAQVASAAGVSKGTASKVLNGRPHVAEETRLRVEEAIKQLSYIPTTGPREPQKAQKVAVVFDDVKNIYAVSVLEGILTAARRQEVDIIIDTVDPNPNGHGGLTPNWIRRQAERDRAGIITVTTLLTASQQASLKNYAIPAVHIDPIGTHNDELISVGATNFIGGMQATQHLVELGHRRIAFAGGPPTSQPERERVQGYISTLTAAGILLDPMYIRESAFTFAAGVKMGNELLDLDPRPTAVFAGCDLIGMGILEAARRRDIRVPEQLSIVGFDDATVAESTAPPLTSVRQPVEEIGRVALRTVLQLSRGKMIDSRHVQLATKLITRESTAPPNGN